LRLRANRLGLPTDQLQLMAETDVDAILASAESLKPKILVVDSIQVVHSETLTSAPGACRRCETARPN
jgi:DNA repair protein RadA/Sms